MPSFHPSNKKSKPDAGIELTTMGMRQASYPLGIPEINGSHRCFCYFNNNEQKFQNLPNLWLLVGNQFHKGTVSNYGPAYHSTTSQNSFGPWVNTPPVQIILFWLSNLIPQGEQEKVLLPGAPSLGVRITYSIRDVARWEGILIPQQDSCTSIFLPGGIS